MLSLEGLEKQQAEVMVARTTTGRLQMRNDSIDSDPMVLLAQAAKLKLFVMLRRTVKADEQKSALGAHLAWIIGAEKQGKIFLSGPVAPHDGEIPLDGLTIVHAASLAHAEELANEDPLVSTGIVRYEMCEWTVNEGAIQLTVTLSDSTARVL